MGLRALRVSKPDELQAGMKEFLEYNDGPILMEVITDKKIPVLPMVPAGKALHEGLVFDLEKEKARRNLMKKRSGH